MDLFVVLVLYVVLAVYGPAKTRLPQRFWHRDRSADPLHQ